MPVIGKREETTETREIKLFRKPPKVPF